MMFTRESCFVAPAYPLEHVVDTTGAGDSFAGGVLGYLAEQNDFSEMTMRNALLYGTAVASFAVSEFSLRCLQKLTREEIEQRVKELRELMRT